LQSRARKLYTVAAGTLLSTVLEVEGRYVVLRRVDFRETASNLRERYSMKSMVRELSDDQIQQIRRGTEDILENVGFRVQHKGLRERCQAVGAVVDETRENVRISPALLHELLGQVPPSYKIADLAGNKRIVGSSGPDNYHAIVTDPWIIDYETQRPRHPTLADVRRHTIAAQKLDQVTAVSLMDYPVTDVKGPTSNLRAMEEHLLHYGKHIYLYVTSYESFQRWLEIGDILTQDRKLAGSRLMSAAVAIISPLVLAEFNAQILLSACQYDFPVMPTVCPFAGNTAPYSLASALLLGNTEAVFLAALTQIIKPGHPYIYAVGPSIPDMWSMANLSYTLNSVVWDAASKQLGRSYGVPVVGGCGGAMTYRYDLQTGAEGMLFALASRLSQADFYHGIGSFYNAIGMSGELMIIHTLWQDMIAFLRRGINTDDLHLGLESIKRVGPGGNFLDDDLTLALLRSDEFFTHPLLDYSGEYSQAPSLLERAHARLEEMVADFESPLPKEVQEGLRRFFRAEYEKLER